MTTLNLVLPIFVLAFVAAIAWTLGCALMITVSKHLEMRLLARRLRVNAERTLRELKTAEAQQAKEKAAPQAVPQSARRWYHMSGEGGQA
ncbi:MAG TPA: hypothetical protein VN622_09010 [Clostridia bacterium]|nr:hypothetical protein [Clostridia bacterium]